MKSCVHLRKPPSSFNNKTVSLEASPFLSRKNYIIYYKPCHQHTAKKLVITRRESLAKRMTQYQENQNLKLTTALDPRFKIQWCGSESEQVNIESLMAATAQHINVTDDTDTSPPSKQARTGFFTILSGTPRKRHTSQRGTKFPQYLNEPAIDMNSDPLMFWKNSEAEYLHLAELANKYLAI